MVAEVHAIYPVVGPEDAQGTAMITEELNPLAIDDLVPAGWEPPAEILLATLGDARLRVIEPIRVALEAENEDFIAEATEFNEFGFGSTRADAIRDLQRAVAELYFSLVVDEARLGSELSMTLQALRQKLSAFA
ncbi:MAG TPA: hypothetical protein VJB57_21545 [Dehalococcoidia bacterium]|nr:hypothetical protein [Dehalococcoidia bacterium]